MKPEEKKAQALEVFQNLDSDGDGIVHKSDLKEFIEDEEKLKEIFGYMDIAKNGNVTFEYFLASFDKIYGDDDDDEFITHDEKATHVPVVANTLPVPHKAAGASRRGSVVNSIKMDEYKLAGDAAKTGVKLGNVQNFDNSQVHVTREQRFKKILDWCENDGAGTVMQFNEIEVSVRYLARPFTDEEAASMIKHMKSTGFAQLTIGTFKQILQSIVSDMDGAYAHAAKHGQPKVEWADDRVVNSFIIKFTGALADPTAGMVDTAHIDTVASLKQEIASLQRTEKTATQKYQKLATHTSSLDQENTDLRNKLADAVAQLSRAKALESGTEGSLQNHKQMIEQFRVQKEEMEKQIASAKQENQNNSAILQMERKIKKQAQEEARGLKDTVTALSQARSEANRLSLVKKLGKMNSIAERRKYVFKLQKDNERLPEIEAENRLLKEKIEKLEAEACEYLRLMDSFRSGPGGATPLDLPSDEGVNLALEMGDDAELEAFRLELEAMRKRIALLEGLLAMEKAAREKAEAEAARLGQELATEKATNEVLRAENSQLKADLLEREAVIVQRDATILELNGRITSLEEELKGLRAKVIEMQAEIDRLTREGLEKDALIAELRARISELERLIEDLRRQLEEEIAWRKRLQKQIEDMGTDAEKRIAALLAELMQLQKELAELKRQLAEALQRIVELEDEVRRLKLALDAALQDNASLRDQLEEARRALAEALAKIKELQDLIARLRAELEEKENEVVTIVEERSQSAPPPSGPAAVLSKQLILTAEQQAEVTAYAICMNQALGRDHQLNHLMPINVETPELLLKVRDGLLLSKWMNIANPGCIDERALNYQSETTLPSEEILQNLNLLISVAKSNGITMKQSDKPMDAAAVQLQFMECTDPDLLIHFIYELIRSKYVPYLNVKRHAELIDLTSTPEVGLSSLKLASIAPKELAALGPDQLLLRWLNWHHIAGSSGELAGGLMDDFTSAKDCVAYSSVLIKISEINSVMSEVAPKTDAQRAKFVLEQARKVGVIHYHRPQMLTAGNPRLNLLFAACVFERSSGFANEDQTLKYGGGGLGSGNDVPMDSDSREERAFRMWINSAGLPGVFLNNLFMDCRDGLALLKVEEWVEPGPPQNPTIVWKKVEMKPNNKFKCVTNCNYAIDVGKSATFNFSLVGIGGEDINEGHDKFILAIVWQLMRHNTIKKLAAMQGTGANKLTDDDILKWANATVATKPHEKNPHDKIKSFKDPDLANSLFLFNLLWALEPKIVDWKMVLTGDSMPDKVRNAGYAISVARKLGADVFLLPHDIAEVKPKMMLLFLGSLMSQRGSR